MGITKEKIPTLEFSRITVIIYIFVHFFFYKKPYV